ncbi:hypothetical protein JF50_11400 [Pseudoalteromonas luteoviolacea]|uniref:Uncharacterized protein n=1 Tax=Pseudoalteromonas luteoviolacea TaxID=43657 RepID=A0A0C1MPK8_9GAMM|nr:DUF1413 domain-containing protein [Pseudoalteromonas luteoviolacea]KID56543.1 hypothetical protein JF50_11400 [Pseudoalteromonas luteoviolacea]
MDEIFKSIKAFLYERSASPLFGAFVISWCAWNYKFIVTLLSSEKLDDKFSKIDTLFDDVAINLYFVVVPFSGEILHGFIAPAIATAFYIYVYPSLAKPVFEHSLKKQKELREIKQAEENNRLLSVEESRKLHTKIAQLQAEFDQDTQDYRSQISSLTETINNLEKDLKEAQGSNSVTPSKFDDINDAEPKEFDESTREKIESLPAGEFQLSDLFTKESWSILDPTLKKSLGKRLKARAERGDFMNVTYKGRGTGNQAIYIKKLNESSNLLDENVASLLANFSGLPDNHGYTSNMLQEEIGENIENIRDAIDRLLELKFIDRLGQNEDGGMLYRLSKDGRKYLIENNLLSNEPA